MKYNFYFDETYHDRKITVSSSGVANIFLDDKNDNYIGVFWGIQRKQNDEVFAQFRELEKKYIERFALDSEFKSTTIAKRNFEYGIQSFNRDAMAFYTDFFELLKKVFPVIHVNTVSKAELLTRMIYTPAMEQVRYVKENSFFYSLTKFLVIYHSPKLLKAIYCAAETGDYKLFQTELLNHIQKVISEIEGIKRKEREVPALRQLYMILSDMDYIGPVQTKYDFIYFQLFAGLSNLLQEKKIWLKNVNLIIDKEEKTYHMAQKYAFKQVTQVNSSDSVGVRVADHLCGFIGRMMYALSNDSTIKEDRVEDIDLIGKNDLTTKRLLGKRWFELKKQHFDLYCLAHEVMVVQQQAYWATMTWSYNDQVIVFYTLLKYVASYQSYDEYNKRSAEEHAEYFNGACCDELQRHYDTMKDSFVIERFQ